MRGLHAEDIHCRLRLTLHPSPRFQGSVARSPLTPAVEVCRVGKRNWSLQCCICRTSQNYLHLTLTIVSFISHACFGNAYRFYFERLEKVPERLYSAGQMLRSDGFDGKLSRIPSHKDLGEAAPIPELKALGEAARIPPRKGLGEATRFPFCRDKWWL